MLATPELIREAAQAAELEARLPRWRAVPLYRERLATAENRFPESGSSASFDQLPFITKREMRAGFPEKFLNSGRTLETLLAEAGRGTGTHLGHFRRSTAGDVRSRLVE